MRPDPFCSVSPLGPDVLSIRYAGGMGLSLMGRSTGGTVVNPESRHWPRMERVLVLGSGGAGKSTFAAQLGRHLQLPVVHLDREFWLPGWVKPEAEAWERRVQELCQRPYWVMDGDYRRTLEPRLAACDTIIFLDLPARLCLRRVLWRSLRDFGRTRFDMSDGCRERLPRPYFLRSIVGYPQQRRPLLMETLGAVGGRTVIVLRSPADVRAFLRATAQARPMV
jgi:adenylate kinase family enzyme